MPRWSPTAFLLPSHAGGEENHPGPRQRSCLGPEKQSFSWALPGQRGLCVIDTVESLLNTYRGLLFMFDIVFPRNNERDFIEMAVRLGFSGLIFVYNDKSSFFADKSPIKIVNALLVPPDRISKAHSAGALAFCDTDARAAIERGADVVFGMESAEGRDKTHYRVSGLNQVLCRIASENKVSIGFSFNKILSASNFERVKLLGRMMQNFLLCKKFKTPVCIGSFARDPFGMRAPGDLSAFFQQLGLIDAKSAMR